MLLSKEFVIWQVWGPLIESRREPITFIFFVDFCQKAD